MSDPTRATVLAVTRGGGTGGLRLTHQGLKDEAKRRAVLGECGRILVSVARAVPGGVLVLLPSFALLESCLEQWRNTVCSVTVARGWVVSRGVSWQAIEPFCYHIVHSRARAGCLGLLDKCKAGVRGGAVAGEWG